jgi:hypothetical protein
MGISAGGVNGRLIATIIGKRGLAVSEKSFCWSGKSVL